MKFIELFKKMIQQTSAALCDRPLSGICFFEDCGDIYSGELVARGFDPKTKQLAPSKKVYLDFESDELDTLGNVLLGCLETLKDMCQVSMGEEMQVCFDTGTDFSDNVDNGIVRGNLIIYGEPTGPLFRRWSVKIKDDKFQFRYGDKKKTIVP